MNRSWQNKVAVVTGASSGIGARIAVVLANLGMIVVGLARRSELIEALNNEVIEGGKIYARSCDLTSEVEVTEVFKWIREKFTEIHVLINNAGVLKANFLSESSMSDIKELFDINVIATANCLKESLQLFRENNTKGHIIIINSILGQRIPEVPMPLFSAYPATKYALSALCLTTRQEIQFFKLNVKLTSVNPGMVDTDLLKIYGAGAAALPKLHVDDIAEAVLYALNTSDNVQIEDINLQATLVFENK